MNRIRRPFRRYFDEDICGVFRLISRSRSRVRNDINFPLLEYNADPLLDDEILSSLFSYLIKRLRQRKSIILMPLNLPETPSPLWPIV